MQNVLTAFFALFLMLYGTFSLTTQFVNVQDKTRVNWQQMQNRMNEQSRTHLSVISSRLVDSGTLLEVVLRNDGLLRLTDFKKWDAIIEYTDDSTTPGYHIGWLGFAASNPTVGQWAISGIYTNSRLLTVENYEVGILNPSEEMIVRVPLLPAVGSGKKLNIAFSTPNGLNLSTIAQRNQLPQLVNNLGITATMGSQTTISHAKLAVTSLDFLPEQLVYTVTSNTTQGQLNLGTTFTQLAIDNNALQYNQTGTSNDTFTFTVSDGTNVIGPYTFNITKNASPQLAANTGLVSTALTPQVISNTMLSLTDADDAPGNVTYTVTVPPTKGTLNMPTTFTQSAIDSSLLTYTPTASGSDSFTFTVSDGKTTVGPYTFNITNP